MPPLRLLNKGDLLAPLTLPEASGELVRTGDFHGRRNLVLFLTHPPGCSGCETRLLELDRSLETLRAEEAEVLAVVPGTPERVRELKRRLALSLPLLVDAEAKPGEDAAIIVADRFGEIFAVSRAQGRHALLSAEQLGEELAYVALQCPE